MKELQAIIALLSTSPIAFVVGVLATIVIGFLLFALIKTVLQNGEQARAMSVQADSMRKQTDAMIETQRIHNETERRRNEERNQESEKLNKVVALSEDQQKKIDTLEDNVASANAAAGGAIKQVQELSKANDRLTADLKLTKDAFDLLKTEYERYQEATDLKLAEANLKITMLESQRELDDKLIKTLKADLEKARQENMTALRTIQNANIQSENAATAWKERFDLQHREIEGLQGRVKQLETVAEERQAARDAARKERDEEVLRVATLTDENKTLRQQIGEMSRRVSKIEVVTGPLMLPGKSESGA